MSKLRKKTIYACFFHSIALITTYLIVGVHYEIDVQFGAAFLVGLTGPLLVLQQEIYHRLHFKSPSQKDCFYLAGLYNLVFASIVSIYFAAKAVIFG